MLHLVLTILLASDFGGGFGSVKFSVANPVGPAAGDIDMQGYVLKDTTQQLDLRSDTAWHFSDIAGTTGVKMRTFAAGNFVTFEKLDGADQNVYMSGTLFSKAVIVADDRYFYFGSSYDTVYGWVTTMTPNSFIVGLNQSSFLYYIIEGADYAYPFNRPQQANPTIHIHSADATTQTWLEIAHDQTNAVLDAGVGNIELKDPLQVPVYTVDQHIVAGAATLGPTSPSWEVNGSVGGLGFDADAESVYLVWEVPDCWITAEDIILKVYWTNESGDALADTETVKWDFEYRVLDFGTDLTTTGTAAAVTATYTQTGAGTDGDTQVTELTLAYNDGNQPLVAGKVVTGRLDRDVTGDTYSGASVVPLWEFSLSANTICNHF